MTVIMVKRNSPARAAIADLPNYFDSKGGAISAVRTILNDYGMELEFVECSGDEGSSTFPIHVDCDSRMLCEHCGDDIKNAEYNNVVSFSWYKMSSGRYEITAYIS